MKEEKYRRRKGVREKEEGVALVGISRGEITEFTNKCPIYGGVYESHSLWALYKFLHPAVVSTS